MKKAIISALLLLFTVCIFSQTGINYKALIKDANNAIVANTQVTVQFTILQGIAEIDVYQETHTPTTDANGIIILNIGEGFDVIGVFFDIDWALEEHFLNTQINTGSGLVNMGTTGFSSVPYAYASKIADIATNVTGLESIDEGNGVGLVKVNRNANNYGNIGINALDLSYSSEGSTSHGATGLNATAIGSNTEALGSYSTAMGYFTQANTIYSTALGYYNVGGGNPSSDILTDPVFEIGNGISAVNRSNALTVLKNGVVLAPSLNISEITDNKALITKEYADTITSTGLEAIDEGNGLGLVKVGRNAITHGNVGYNAVDLSYSGGNPTVSADRGATGQASTAMGWGTTASGSSSTVMGANSIASGPVSTAMGADTESSGQYSTAMGSFTIASGAYSTAMGTTTEATGLASTAMGWFTEASADYSTAMGRETNADSPASTAMGYNTYAVGSASTAMGNATESSGENSTSMGFNTQAQARNCVALGSYNIGSGSSFVDVPTDAVFEIGNGTSHSNRRNAVSVLKNGNVAIGNITPGHLLDIDGRARIRRGGASTAGIWYTDSAGNDNIFAGVKAHHTTSVGSRQWGVYISGWNFWVNGNGDVVVSGATVHSSDRRLKKDIEAIPYGLNEILQLKPKAYNWKAKGKEYKSLGLIAQDVQSVIKNVVQIADDEKQTLGVSYTELIPVLIKAMQEQQAQIQILKQEKISLAKLEQENNTLKRTIAQYKSLEQRLATLESKDVVFVATTETTKQ